MDEKFGYWLAGLIDGEGHFAIRRLSRHSFPTLRFEITMRVDDAPMLEMIRDTLGFGQIYTRKSGHTNPQGYKSKRMVSFVVWNKTDTKNLANLLRQFPLRSKKQRDFLLWAEAADLWYSTDFVGWKTRWGINPVKAQAIGRLEELAIEIIKVRKCNSDCD